MEHGWQASGANRDRHHHASPVCDGAPAARYINRFRNYMEEAYDELF